jgi:hypothetical protein
MLSKKFVLLVAVILSSLVFVGTASASATDWTQRFQQSSTETYFGAPVGEFDRIGIWWISGDKFTIPAFTNFSVSGWSNTNVSDTYAYAIGPESTDLYFNISFLPPKSAGTAFYFMAANGSDVRQRQYVSFDGTNWNAAYGVSFPEVALGDWTGPAGVVTPEPISSALFLLGGGAIAALKLRKKKSA